MNKKQIANWAREDTFRNVISRSITQEDMQGIQEWIRDNVISKEGEPIDHDAVDIFQKAQITLCQSFLRCSNTDSVKKLLGMYKGFTEPAVHQLELNMIKQVVELELHSDRLFGLGKTFLKQQAAHNFGLSDLSAENKEICDEISKLLGDV